MKIFRRAAAAAVWGWVLMGSVLPQVHGEEVMSAGLELSGRGGWSMLSGLGLGILCAGGLTILITTQGRRK